MQQLAEQLRAAGVPAFPCWARHNAQRNKWDKGPAVPKGEPWQLTALRPTDDPALNWSSGVIGVPVPPGVLVIDLDGYKGASRQAIDGLLGCPLPWDGAFIQTTISGGEHYAFRCDWDARQGDSLDGLNGFDTRAAGKGFICSGSGYAPRVHGGVLAFGSPHLLPVIPDGARQVLERREAEPLDRTADSQAAPEDVLDALRHIDPSCSRSQWRNVGYSLKALFADNDNDGMHLFDQWSAGELWDGEAPHNYVGEGKGSVVDQWPTFKTEGGVSPSTLYYWALQGGWKPSARFDASSAFGPGAAPPDAFNDLVERIRQEGCDIKATQAIVDDIKAAGCNALQVALLAAELKTELSDAGLKDKAVSGHIDGLLRTVLPVDLPQAPPGMYGSNDTDNAAVFLDKFYPDGNLARCDGAFYRFTGKAWSQITADTVKHQLTVAMAGQRMQDSKISACWRMVTNLSPVLDGVFGDVPDHLVLFDNGVLDLRTGQLGPHDRSIFSTNIMPYAWNPSAQCPAWMAFLDDVFDYDPERSALLQEWVGYLLTRDYSHQKIMFMLGGPRCGKGTIGRVLSELVGMQNFSGGSLSSLANDSYIDGISEKPVVFIGDAEKKVAPAKTSQVIERLKTISGNDAVSWHRMYHGGLSRTLPTRFTMAANSVPALFDDSGALASRLLLLTFDKSYLGREDLTLGDRLLGEVEGIAAWALQGLHRLRAVGQFTQPAASAEEVQLIAEAYSPVLRFVEECCEIGKGHEMQSKEMYDTYRAWSVAEGEEPMRPKILVSSVRDAFRGKSVRYGTHRFNDGTRTRGFKGLRLKSEALDLAIQGAFQPRVVQ
ncbi:PriCT-2 domain-containing protein [bacterium]|nr:PriCT-2 domain-containing protein [bacterium]